MLQVQPDIFLRILLRILLRIQPVNFQSGLTPTNSGAHGGANFGLGWRFMV